MVISDKIACWNFKYFIYFSSVGIYKQCSKIVSLVILVKDHLLRIDEAGGASASPCSLLLR